MKMDLVTHEAVLKLMKEYRQNGLRRCEMESKHFGAVGPRNPLPLEYYDAGIRNIAIAKEIVRLMSPFVLSEEPL